MAYRSINPFTGQLVKEYPSHTAEEVEQALTAADAAFRDPSWRGVSTAEQFPASAAEQNPAS